MRWVGYVARMGERRGVYSVLVEKPDGRRPLGRHKHNGRIILNGSSVSGMWRYGLDRTG